MPTLGNVSVNIFERTGVNGQRDWEEAEIIRAMWIIRQSSKTTELSAFSHTDQFASESV